MTRFDNSVSRLDEKSVMDGETLLFAHLVPCEVCFLSSSQQMTMAMACCNPTLRSFALKIPTSTFSRRTLHHHARPWPAGHSNFVPSLPGQARRHVLTRAAGQGDSSDGRKEPESGRRFVSPELESAEESGFWKSVWGVFGGGGTRKRAGGFSREGLEYVRGQRELEELDLMLEGGNFEFQWKDVLEPSVENVLALLLTALLLYAVVLIGWQLLLVAAAITLSALKYSVIAAIILAVLIFLI